jgi:hypothetical protein
MRNLKAQDQKRYNAISKWYTTAGSGDAERPNMSWDSHQPIASDESTDRRLHAQGCNPLVDDAL